MALDRSGSMTVVHGATGPASTRQVSASESSTRTPTERSAATVILTCGWDGMGAPSCTTLTPRS